MVMGANGSPRPLKSSVMARFSVTVRTRVDKRKSTYTNYVKILICVTRYLADMGVIKGSKKWVIGRDMPSMHTMASGLWKEWRHCAIRDRPMGVLTDPSHVTSKPCFDGLTMDSLYAYRPLPRRNPCLSLVDPILRTAKGPISVAIAPDQR